MSINQTSTILVVFGATGDLMAKKITPSLFYLYKNKQLPNKFRVLGFSRRKLTNEQFREHIFGVLKKEKIESSRKKTKAFLSMFDFQQGSFDDYQSFVNLKKNLERIDDRWKICTNKLFYLAIPPHFIKGLLENLKKSDLNKPCGGLKGWSRLIIEKPFGSDAKSAHELEKILANSFEQEQIYRIDHYLGKEMVQGIINFRFSNNLLEHNWNNQHIEKIEMKLLEKIGVEDRGSFYESVGALKDVGQNHLLAILALITMNNPASFNAEAIRSSRIEILKNMHKPSQAEIEKNTFRAQYNGYKNIKGVKKNSKIETYFKIITQLNTTRWKGVPISIESGKRMGEVDKDIVVTFKHPHPCLCPPNEHFNNRVIFSLHPKQEIIIEFWAKKPGFALEIEKRTFDFMLHKQKSDMPYVEEYAKLILDCISGEQAWFIDKDEIKEMWRVIDPIEEAWQKDLVPLHKYKPDNLEIRKKAEGLVKMEADKKDFNSVGIVGLGKMGGNIARHLIGFGWDIVGYNRSPNIVKEIEREGMRGAYSLEELVEKLPSKKPKIIWLMVPAGKPVDEVLFGKLGLVKYLRKDDIIIDGGNSFYKNTVERQQKLKKYGIHYLDCGVSGGPSGARSGACLMIGGDPKIFNKVEPLFRDIAQNNGYQFFSGVGAGHFVKMVHNGIEYGMMQAIAEGFAIMKKSKYKLDLTKVSDIYNNGSVIESRLVGWLKDAFDIYGEDLEPISGKVHHSGEGEWTVKTAQELKVKDKIIEGAYKFRLESQKNPSYTGKVVSALRGQFGGHPVFEQSKHSKKKKTTN